MSFRPVALAGRLLGLHRMRLASLAVLAFAVAGCTISFDDDDDSGDDGCLGPPAQELRDPQTGRCQAFGGGCGPQPQADPDWAACGDPCEGLDQPSCEVTTGCRAIFVDTCPECDALVLAYAACWGTAPSGPIEGGSCNGLDAHACSQHDDCAAVHVDLEAPAGDGGFTNTIGDFESCQPERSPSPFTCGELTCAGGQYCAITYPGVPGAPIDYRCADLPSSCAGDPSNACACLADLGVCTSDCTFDAAGNLTTRCFLD